MKNKMDSGKKSIHIGGVFYGLHNIGDEGILYSMIQTFHEKYQVSVSSYDSEWISNYFSNVEIRPVDIVYDRPKMGLRSLPRRKIIDNMIKNKDYQKYIKTKDAFICGGATILSDCPWHSLRMAELAGRSGIPVYFWGVGMAEVGDTDTTEYIRFVLNKPYVKKIYVRDELVRDRLVSMGINRNKTGISYDPAVMLEGETFNLEDYLSSFQAELYKNECPNIIITLSGEADVVEKTPVDVISACIGKMQERYRANIFLIPTGCGKHCKDIEFLKNIAKELNVPEISVIEKEFSPQNLVEFLKQADLILSSRLHMNIFGACAGVPSIGLVRNRKIIDFAELHGLPYLELSDLSQKQLLEMTDEVFSNRNAYREKIKKNISKMREQYMISAYELQKLIDG